MLHVRRLNHAVLWVRDVDVSADFYTRVMGFSVVDQMPGQAAASGRPGPTTTTTSGCSPWVRTLPSRAGQVGLYHLAWEVETIDELAKARQVLSDAEAGGPVRPRGHEVLYAQDPDGNEFEVMWMVPREDWGDFEKRRRPVR